MNPNSCLSFRRLLPRLLRPLSFCLLLHFCAGQYNLISSRQLIVARVGDDIMLPCHLEPVMDVAAKTLEWTRPDLDNIFVLVWRSGQELMKTKHPSYTGRSSLFPEELKHGNISLKLSKVKISDKGTYKCFIPELRTQSVVEVFALDAAALPVITFLGTDRDSGELVLQCESEGWYPEPEVLWLDAEGRVLSAGPTETVRGPDDLYTVSSRVTVDKRHGNRFTCRVQQTNINQTRETQIHVPDDFFYVQSSISPATVGLASSLGVCILLILSLVLILWKKQNKLKKSQWENDKGQRKNNSATEKTEDQASTEIGRQREPLMTEKTSQMEEFKGTKKNHLEENLKEEKQKIEEAEKEVETLKQQLEDKNKELQEEKQKREEAEREVETWRNQLEELEKKQTDTKRQLQWETEKRDKAEREVRDLKNQLEEKKKELDRKVKEETRRREEAEREAKSLKSQLEEKNKEAGGLMTEVQKLKTENQQMKMELEKGNKKFYFF